MAHVKYDEMKQIVLKLRDAQKIADHFGCDLRAANNMKLLVESEAGLIISREADRPTVGRPSLKKRNPKDDPLEWQYEEEKRKMAEGSYNLLCAMLMQDQHRLPEDIATKIKKDLGLQYRIF